MCSMCMCMYVFTRLGNLFWLCLQNGDTYVNVEVDVEDVNGNTEIKGGDLKLLPGKTGADKKRTEYCSNHT